MQRDDIIKSEKEFAAHASDLLDSEAQRAMQIIFQVQMKYRNKANTVTNLEALRDEALTRLAEVGITATLDATPCFYGEPPILELLSSNKAMDHEQKKFEVVRATQRNEDYLGQKERSIKRPKKKK